MHFVHLAFNVVRYQLLFSPMNEFHNRKSLSDTEQASLIAEDMEAQSSQLSHDVNMLVSLVNWKKQGG